MHPREINIEMGDDDRPATTQDQVEPPRWPTPTTCSGSPTAGPRRRRPLRARSRTSRSARRTATARSASAADEPSVPRRRRSRSKHGGRRPPRPPAALRHRQGRRRQDARGGGPRRARREHGKRTLVVRGGRQGRPRRAFEADRRRFDAARGAAGPLRDGDGHRGVAARVPEAVSCRPARRAHRPARPDLRLRRRRRAGREGDPRPSASSRCEVRERAATTSSSSTPRHRSHRRRSSARPRRSASSCRSASSATRPRWMLDILDDPRATGVVIVTTPEEMPVTETIELVGALRAEDDGRPRRRRRQPRAARAVRAGRGGAVRARCASRPGRRRSSASVGEPPRRGARRRRARGDAAPHAAPRTCDRCATSSTRRRRCCTCPSCSPRAHGLRATSLVAEALGEELGY